MPDFGDFDDKFRDPDTAKVVLLPVPYDATSTYIKGSGIGPAAILDASYQLENYDIETNSEPYKAGIYTAEAVTENSSPEKMIVSVHDKTAGCLSKDKFVVTIGGEHSVSIGAIQAHAEKVKDLCVLQLDAHADLRDEYQGSKFNHACVMARVKEFCPIVQVGIRSMDIAEKNRLSPAESSLPKTFITTALTSKAYSINSPRMFISPSTSMYSTLRSCPQPEHRNREACYGMTCLPC